MRMSKKCKRSVNSCKKSVKSLFFTGNYEEPNHLLFRCTNADRIGF